MDQIKIIVSFEEAILQAFEIVEKSEHPKEEF